MRDGCILLANERPYREYPLDIILQFLKQAGYSIEGVAFFETTYSAGIHLILHISYSSASYSFVEFVEKQVEVALSKLYKIEDEKVAGTMKAYLLKLQK